MTERKQIYEILVDTINEALADLHTVTVARVTRVGSTTISCRPVINRNVNGESIQLPEFIEVPPVFLQGGGSYTAHPIAVGDYCLLIITERCFDTWYNGQDFRRPLEYRMHDYSDGFALVGVNPLASAITIPSLITQIGDTYQQGDYERDGDTIHNGNMTINGNLTVNGDITCSQRVTAANVTVGGIDFLTHVHPENDNGGPTDPPQGS